MYGVNEVMNCFISIKTWLRRLYESKHAGHVPCGVRYKQTINFTYTLKVLCSLFTLRILLQISQPYCLSHDAWSPELCRKAVQYE